MGGTPPRRTQPGARMRDPEALQVGPGAVARLRSPILIKTSISFSRLRSLLPSARRRMDELPGPSHRTRLREGTGKPDFYNNPHFISIFPAPVSLTFGQKADGRAIGSFPS